MGGAGDAMQPANRYALLDALERAFPGVPPLGHELRAQYPERWFRIHSLPLSKRHPESVLHRTTLYNRQQAVASHLFGMGTPVIVLVYDWSREPSISASHALSSLVPD